MKDLVWHLRAVPKELEAKTAECKVYAGAMAHEAADEIERLREALSTIAISYYKDMPDGVDPTVMWVGCTEVARFALQQKESA